MGGRELYRQTVLLPSGRGAGRVIRVANNS